MPVFLAPILAAAKSIVMSYVAGYIMKGVINVVKVGTPKLWAKVPESIRPYISAILGTAAGVVAGDPTMLITDAVAGAAGGVTAKMSHDAEKPEVMTPEKIRELLGND